MYMPYMHVYTRSRHIISVRYVIFFLVSYANLYLSCNWRDVHLLCIFSWCKVYLKHVFLYKIRWKFFLDIMSFLSCSRWHFEEPQFFFLTVFLFVFVIQVILISSTNTCSIYYCSPSSHRNNVSLCSNAYFS